MLDRILVPLDGSPVAASAPGFAALIPSRRVALLRVEHLSADGSAAAVADLDIAVTARALAAEDLRRHGREVEPMAIGGDPAEEIPRVAEDADLIVMTTRGAGPVHRAVFGSVADRVAHHATVPVLLLRGDNRPTTAPLVSRLVVPLDGSDRAESALSFATDLAGDLGVGLHLLRVVEADPVRDAVRGGPLATGAQSEATERAVSEASRYLNRLAQRARDGDGSASTGVRVGYPAAEITAALRPGDLVVMSARARRRRTLAARQRGRPADPRGRRAGAARSGPYPLSGAVGRAPADRLPDTVNPDSVSHPYPTEDVPMTDPFAFQTRCIHAGEAPDPSTGAHGVPLYQNVTYAFRSFAQVEAMRAGQAPHFTYSPRGNPTVRCLELKLADLEGAEVALATTSGMAAISATLLALAGGGGHVVASDEVYDLTHDVLTHDLPAFGGSATLVPIGDLAAVEGAIRPDTRLLYAEPFSNPLLRVADLPRLAAIARRHGIPLVVDNTFLSPALLRPLEHDADLVVHSATKYLSGFGQVQGGVVAGRRDLVDRVRDAMIRLGGQMPPFAAWMLLAGVKTLPMRVRRHAENAGRIARLLADHPAVARVHYPGLPEDPGHDVAARMLGNGPDRFGGMVSFALTGGRTATAAFVDTLRIATIAVSLGDVSTLVWPWHDRDLIRLSVGIEDGDDLLRDVGTALDAAAAAISPHLAGSGRSG